MRIDLTTIQVRAVMDMLGDALGEEEDDRLVLDTLAGETDLFELCAKLLAWVEEEEGYIAALKGQIEDRQTRKARSEARLKHHREAITALMEAARQDKLVLPEATLSVRDVAAKLVVNDPAAVPEGFATMVPKPNMDAIKSAFSVDTPSLPNWLRVDPAKPSLTIRRK